MTSFKFSIKALLPKDELIYLSDDLLEIQLPETDKKITLSQIIDPNYRTDGELILTGGDFLSEEEAYEYAFKIKKTIILCSLRLQLGIDAGRDKPLSWTFISTVSTKEQAKEAGYTLLDDIHGISVYSCDKPTLIMSMEGRSASGPREAKFKESFLESYELDPKFTDKQRLAIELYIASHFESSVRAKFITLITAIECISNRNKSSNSAVSFLSSIAATIEQNDELQELERDTLLERINDLKRESISAACRRLVEQSLGYGEMEFFKLCYKLRSKLVHEGKAQKDVDIRSYVQRLDNLVSSLLFAHVANSSQ